MANIHSCQYRKRKPVLIRPSLIIDAGPLTTYRQSELSNTDGHCTVQDPSSDYEYEQEPSAG